MTTIATTETIQTTREDKLERLAQAGYEIKYPENISDGALALYIRMLNSKNPHVIRGLSGFLQGK